MYHGKNRCTHCIPLLVIELGMKPINTRCFESSHFKECGLDVLPLSPLLVADQAHHYLGTKRNPEQNIAPCMGHPPYITIGRRKLLTPMTIPHQSTKPPITIRQLKGLIWLCRRLEEAGLWKYFMFLSPPTIQLHLDFLCHNSI